MKLEARKVLPGSKLIYACPEHPDQQSDKPGPCPKCKKKLAFKIVSDATRLVEGYVCAKHPGELKDKPGACDKCQSPCVRVETEAVLAVPFLSVIDSGGKKVVYVERGTNTYVGLEMELGPRAGEWVQVLKGLAAGDKVATAGAFLLDADSRLSPAAGVVYFGASDKK